MSAQSQPLARWVSMFDKFGLWSGSIIAWLIIPMVMSLVYEVVARYFFNAPTVWVALQWPPMAMLWLILGLIFVLAWPLEWVPIVLVVVPIVLPIIKAANIDLLWFCTLVAVCLQTAWLSPPVALSAYFLKGVVPDWKLSDIYYGMMQFMVLQLIGLALIFFFPQIALWLPSVLRN